MNRVCGECSALTERADGRLSGQRSQGGGESSSSVHVDKVDRDEDQQSQQKSLPIDSLFIICLPVCLLSISLRPG